jgi:hypothetical protein
LDRLARRRRARASINRFRFCLPYGNRKHLPVLWYAWKRHLDVFSYLKRAVPVDYRSLLKVQHYNYIFRRALKKFARDPHKWIYSKSPVIADLVRGWHNEDWSANDEYLLACLEFARRSDGPILECGSGLTTIVLGSFISHVGRTLWSLEDNPYWGNKVQMKLRAHDIVSVRLCVNPIQKYSGFSWYEPPLNDMPQFSLVICDGPPVQVAGGRYGMLPIMKQKLKPGAIILLDDLVRAEEQAVAARWAAELKTRYQIYGPSDSPYAVLTVPEPPWAADRVERNEKLSI